MSPFKGLATYRERIDAIGEWHGLPGVKIETSDFTNENTCCPCRSVKIVAHLRPFHYA